MCVYACVTTLLCHLYVTNDLPIVDAPVGDMASTPAPAPRSTMQKRRIVTLAWAGRLDPTRSCGLFLRAARRAEMAAAAQPGAQQLELAFLVIGKATSLSYQENIETFAFQHLGLSRRSLRFAGGTAGPEQMLAKLENEVRPTSPACSFGVSG